MSDKQWNFSWVTRFHKRFWGTNWADHFHPVKYEVPTWNDAIEDYEIIETTFDVLETEHPNYFERPRSPGDSDLFLGTQGRILIRKEYEALYKETLRVYEELPDNGVLIVGDPGIGKTVYLFYALARRLCEKRCTILYSRGVISYFHGNGPDQIDTNITGLELAKLLSLTLPKGEQLPWALINADQEPAPRALNSAPGPIFPILASSPNPRRCNNFAKHWGAVRFYVNPWNWDETVAGGSLHSRNDVKVLHHLFTMYGPSARDIFNNAKHPLIAMGYEIELNNAINAMDPNKVQALLGSGTPDSSLSRKLFITYRTGPLSHPSLRTEPITPYVTRELVNRLRAKNLEDVQKLCDMFRVPVITSATAALFYESVSHNVLSRPAANDFQLFPMLNTGRTGIYKNTRCFILTSDPSGVQEGQGMDLDNVMEQADVSLDMDVELELDVLFQDKTIIVPRKGTESFPAQQRERVTYKSNTLSRKDIRPGKYFIPADTHNPAFDSFAVTSDAAFAFQMTIAKTHSCNPKGVIALLELFSTFTTLNFVIVIPAGRRDVQWYIPMDYIDRFCWYYMRID